VVVEDGYVNGIDHESARSSPPNQYGPPQNVAHAQGYHASMELLVYGVLDGGRRGFPGQQPPDTARA
jgi:hypothetical protein